MFYYKWREYVLICRSRKNLSNLPSMDQRCRYLKRVLCLGVELVRLLVTRGPN